MTTPQASVSTRPLESGLVCFRLGLASATAYVLFQIDFLGLSASLLLGVYFAAKLIARASLSGLTLSLSTKQTRTRSGAPIQARLTLRNRNRFLPIFQPLVSVRESGSARVEVFHYQGAIPPRGSQTIAVTPSLSTRGVQTLEAFAVRSRFPFALQEARCDTSAKSDALIVWPKPISLDFDSIFNEPPLFRYNTSGERIQNTQDTEAALIRDYQLGDPKPLINWKLSAKLDKLTVIEPRDERQERYELHLSTSTRLWKSELAFERMIGQVSSLVSELSRRKLIQGITIDAQHLPLLNNRQKTLFFDTLASLRASRRDQEAIDFKRYNHLWILPAPNSQITLASQWARELSGKALR